MQVRRTLTLVATSLALLSIGTAARAETQDDNSFSGMFILSKMDTNKDGMVSKAEFLAMMGKVWDMKAKEMQVKGDKMNAEDVKKLSGFLSRGEKNRAPEQGGLSRPRTPPPPRRCCPAARRGCGAF